jgi:hypothetical protein
MKKLLVSVTLMVAIFGFTAGAFAAFGDPICVSCKGTLRNIPLITIASQTTGVCTGFDYDLNSAADGYCTYSSKNNYRLIFQVCNCDVASASQLVPGFRVAIRMEILVNGKTGANGAYWSGTGVPAAINFNDYLTPTAACNAATSDQTKTFGPPTFYLADGTTTAGLAVDPTCTVPSSQKSTILSTPRGPASGYVITLADVNLSSWWIDIPPIRVDPAVVKSGDIISVNVQIFDATLTPVCPTCVVCLCQCTVDVARVDCGTASTSSLLFNYFTSLTAGDYWNGMAIANPGTTAGSCALKAVEADGSVGTATISIDAGKMFVGLVETITWAGTGLGGSPAYITATCNYSGAFGFAMMSNKTHDSMGYKVP